MSSIGEYLSGVLCAALICGIVSELMGKKGVSASLIKILCGIFMTLSVIAPLVDIRMGPLEDLTNGIRADAQSAIAEGESMAVNEYRTVIKQRTEAYILDKANSLGAEVQVSVSLDEGELAQPCSVIIRGRISPYAKGLLSNWLSTDLGIHTEEQKWIATN